MSINRKAISIVTIMAVLVAGVMLYSFGTKKEKTLPVAEAHKTSVKVEQAKTIANGAALSFKATLEPVDEGIVSSKVGGKVVSILFQDGKQVTQGEPLVELDDRELRNQLKAAETDLQKLKINLETSQHDYDRYQQLFDSDAIPKVDLENAETVLNNAKADLESANVKIQNLKDSLQDTVIEAPISGTMDEKNVSLGQYVSPGTVLGKVKNVASLNAVIQVNQDDAEYIKVGQKAQVKLSEHGSVYEGVVKSIGVSADPSARVFNCKVQIENKNQLLHPGVYATVDIVTDQQKKMLVLPIGALSGSEGEYSVFIIENGVARKRSVNIGEIDQQLAEVKSGIKEGEKVIVTNLNTLQDGDEVVIAGQGETK